MQYFARACRVTCKLLPRTGNTLGEAHVRGLGVRVRRARGAALGALVAAAAAAGLLTIASVVHATTYYVRASGDESNDGLTPHTARARVRSTGRLLRRPGDRLIVR